MNKFLPSISHWEISWYTSGWWNKGLEMITATGRYNLVDDSTPD
jgi:hypothetical protein